MNLKRFIGKTEVFPNYYIELYQNQQKVIISRLVYDRKTLKLVPFSLFTNEEQTLIGNLQKRDCSAVKGEEFKYFMGGQKAYRNLYRDIFGDDGEDEMKFLYGDRLFNEKDYVSFHDTELQANVILNFHSNSEEASKNQFTLFTTEQMDYPSILFFIHKSMKDSEFDLFLNPMDTSDNRTSFAVCRWDGDLYVAKIKNEVDVINVKKYDQNFNQVTDTGNLDEIRKIINTFTLVRAISLLEKV